ncbi:hypothetical protein [Actinoallomurus sp. CA-142502]|uniref:hypothetical protein n=1 Tax=Actinoallomurus sp. CA-142502 TaxID=3239885 RepID=UPI003D93DF96
MTGNFERSFADGLARKLSALANALTRRGLFPRNTAARVFYVLAAVGVVVTALSALPGKKPDPNYVPTCNGVVMARTDQCSIMDFNGNGSGLFTYDEMVARHNDSVRTANRHAAITSMVAAPLTVIFGALSFVVATRERRRRRKGSPATAADNATPTPPPLEQDPFALLARERGWVLGPPSAQMPTGQAELGTPVGTVTGRLGEWPIAVQRYTRWTQITVSLPVRDLPKVRIAIDHASGQARYVHEAAFGEELMTPRVRDTARQANITEFSVVGRVLTLSRREVLTAPGVDTAVQALTALATALPSDVLRRRGQPVM